MILVAAWCCGDVIAKDKSNESVVEGTLVAVSRLPSAKDSEYPDCLLITKFQVSRVLSGELSERQLLLAVWGFRDRKDAFGAALRVGDRFRVQMIPFEDAGDITTVRQADDLDEFELPLYWAKSVKKAGSPVQREEDPEAEKSSPKSESPETTIAVPRSEVPATEIASERGKSIERDLLSMEALLARHGGDWGEWHRELKPLRSWIEENRLKEAKHWSRASIPFRTRAVLSLDPTSQEGPGAVPKQVKMFAAFDKHLKSKGIDLILVPFPFREEISGSLLFENLLPGDGICALHRLKIVHDLLKADVEVVDLLPAFRQAAENGVQLYYPKDNHHPADSALRLAAEVINSRLKRYKWRYDADPPDLKEKQVSFLPPHERFSATQVLVEEGNMIPLRVPASPLLVLGDSYARYPRRSGYGSIQSANLGSQIAFLSGVVPDQYSVSSLAHDLFRHVARMPKSVFSGKRVCVLVYAPYYATYTGPHPKTWEVRQLN